MLKKNIFQKLKNTNKVFIIAEAGSNHLKNLNRAYKLVDIAKSSGADAIKFQSFKADEIAVKNLKYNKIKNKFRKYSNNLFDFYQKFELPDYFNLKLHDYCKKKGIIFMTSVFGDNSFEIAKKLSPIIKIASFESNYFELFDKLIKVKKQIIISTGCSYEKDIIKIKNFFKKKKYTNFSILHCGSSYPLELNQVDLNYIIRLKQIFPNNIIGYSDHTKNISTSVAAATLGAKIIEKHFTISRDDGAPDSFFSLEKHELKRMVTEIRETQKVLGKPKKIIYKSISIMQKGRRSYYAQKNLKKGTIIRAGDFKALRPHVKSSLSIDFYFKFIGKKLKKNINFLDPLKSEHI